MAWPVTIVVRDGKIAEVRSDQSGPPPPAERVIDATGKVVTAGFWNCHVHFTEPKWSNAGEQAEATLAQHLRDMVTSHGFTSVVDTGSDPVNTIALRKRIEAGLPGPRIVLAGGSFVGEKGSPAYLEVKLPEVTTPDQAQRLTSEVLDQGADHIKIFTGSYVGTGPGGVDAAAGGPGRHLRGAQPGQIGVRAPPDARRNPARARRRRRRAGSHRAAGRSVVSGDGHGNGREGHEPDPHAQTVALRAHPREGAARRASIARRPRR